METFELIQQPRPVLMRLKESSWYLACNEVVLSTHINTAFSNAQDIKTQEYLFYYVMHVT